LTYSCANCDRLFQTRAGKWKHEKICDGITVSPTNWKQGNADDESDVEQLKSILLSFIAQNKLDLSELHKQMNELHQTTSNQQNNFIGNNNVVNNNCTNEEMVVYHQSKYPTGSTCVKQNVAERHNNNNVASYLLYFLNS
jgi:hypothetical protein